jgi:hypothetical protein
MLHLEFLSFLGLRHLDTHQGFALDPLGLQGSPTPAFHCTPPVLKFLDPPMYPELSPLTVTEIPISTYM